MTQISQLSARRHPPVLTLNGIEIVLPGWLRGTPIEDKIRQGTYEETEAQAVLKRLGKGMRVLEIGAGLSYVSALCARKVGPDRVVSVEANPRMLPVIHDTLARNGLEGVAVMQGAVRPTASADETVRFHSGPLFWGGAVVEDGETRNGAIHVPALSLHDIFELWKPNFVMMDIEGGEQHLFDIEWPACVARVVLELHPKKYPATVIKKIVDTMSGAGLTYDPFSSEGRTLGFMRVT